MRRVGRYGLGLQIQAERGEQLLLSVFFALLKRSLRTRLERWMVMAFTVKQFWEFIQLLETQPELRSELRRLLIPEALIDLPRSLQALADAQRRLDETLAQVTERMERGFAEAAAERQRIWETIERLTERMERGFAEAAADRERIWEAMRQGFAEAAADRQRIWEAMRQGFTEAAADRERIWEAMRQGFAEAAADRERIWEAMQQGFAEAAADRERIWEAMRQGFAEAAAERRQGFAEAAADRERIWEAMRQGFAEAAADRCQMRHDIARLKGLTKETYYRDRAVAIFGHLMAGGRDATEQIARHLQSFYKEKRITAEEYQSVLDADLLFRGRLVDTDEEVLLVLEASWTVHEEDVERAAQRAQILRRAELPTLPVAAGEEWPDEARALAHQRHVVIIQDGRVDDESWRTALADLR